MNSKSLSRHDENLAYRRELKHRKKIVVKVGSSSLLHAETGRMDYRQIDMLTRELSNIKNGGREVILVSSGATAVGREVIHFDRREPGDDSRITFKQACAAIGQARLMMIYQKFFSDYNQIAGQVLMTKNTVTNVLSNYNIRNTFAELLRLGVVPIVNENDSVATYEYSVGDNDHLSAMVCSLVGADLLILLSDIDGLYTDDPRRSHDAEFIEYVDNLTEEMLRMGKGSTGSESGTGGMSTKLSAAQIATRSGCDMVIASSRDLHILDDIMEGKNVGTLFRSRKDPDFDLREYIEETMD